MPTGEFKRIIGLLLIMSAVALTIAGLAIGVLYHTAFEEQRQRLIEVARSRVSLMESVARFDRAYSKDYPGGAVAATIAQLAQAQESFTGFGRTGEFTLARRQGDRMVFILPLRHDVPGLRRTIPLVSERAEPMRRALANQTGTLVGLDYRGVDVLSAFEPVDVLDLGVVAKIDLAEIRAPFLRAGLIVAGLVSLVIALGTLAFYFTGSSMLRRLRLSEAHYQTLVEEAADAIILADRQGRYLDINQFGIDLLGYPKAEFLQKNIRDIIDPGDQARTPIKFDEMLRQRRTVRIDRQLLRKDGSLVPVEATAKMLPDGRILGIYRDISRRREAEQLLARQALISQQMSEGVFVVNSEGRFTDLNPAAERMFGYSKAELLGRPSHMLNDEEIPGTQRSKIMTEVERQGRWSGEVPIVRKNGDKGVCEISVVAIDDPAAQPGSSIVVTRDVSQRKQAELALRESQRHLAEAQHLGQIGHFRAAVDGSWLEWSDELWRTFGFEPGSTELSFELVLSMIHADDLQPYLQLREQAVATRQTLSTECRIQRHDGEERILSFLVEPEFGQGGGVSSLFGTAQDITEKRRSEQALRQRELELSAIMGSTPDAIMVINDKGIIETANPATQKLFGYSSDELIGESLLLIVPERYHDRMAPLYSQADDISLQQIFGTGNVVDGVTLHRDGHEIPVEFSWQQMNLAGRNAFVFISRDVTARRRAEAALKESEESYRRLTEDSIQGTAIIEDGVLVYVSPSYAEQLGYGVDELIGQSVDVVNGPEHHQELAQRRAACLSGSGGPAHYEFQALRKDGQGIWVDQVSQSVSWQGRPAIQVSLINVNERRELRENMAQAQKLEAIGRLTGGVAHDFNNLLMAIMANLEMLEEDLGEDDERSEMVRLAIAAARRGADVTHRLLAFAKQEFLAPEAIDLRQLVADTILLLRPVLGVDVDIKTRSVEPLPQAFADPGHLQNALVNLAINACDAMPDGGQLFFDLEAVEPPDAVSDEAGAEPTAAKPQVVIAVRDSGSGIDPKIRDRVFEPFFTTKGLANSSGLGLSMVQGFSQQSGGGVKLESSSAGTVVRLYLPQIESVEAKQPEPVPKRTQRGEETVLLAEDDAVVRESLRLSLKRLGYEVVEAEDGPAALDLLVQHQIDLLVTDLVMPRGMDGRALAEQAQRNQPDLAVVFISGFAEAADAVAKVDGNGDEAILRKPFAQDDLAQALRSALEAG